MKRIISFVLTLTLLLGLIGAALPGMSPANAADASSFDITWSSGNNTYFKVTVHYVDESGNPVNVSIADQTIGNRDTLTFSTFARAVSGMRFIEARYGSVTGSAITTVSASQNWFGSTFRNLTFRNGATDVASVTRNPGESTRNLNVYMVYEEDKDTPSIPTLDKSLTHDKIVTDNGDGTFDLTLTVSGAIGSTTNKVKLDILLIIDKSGSMEFDLDRDEGRNNERIDAVADAVDVLTDSISSNSDNIDARYSIVAFSNNYGTSIIETWTHSDSTVDAKVAAINPGGGTNYQAAIYYGKQALSQARADAQKVVIFLTDGLPTRRGVSGNEGGNGQDDREGRNQAAAVTEIQGMSCNAFYAVGVGPEFDAETKTGYKNLKQLCENVGTGTGATAPSMTAVYTATDTTALNQAFAQMAADSTQILCDNVTVTDKLSENVQITTKVEAGNTVPSKMVVSIVKADGTILGGTASSVALSETDANKAATISAIYDNGQIKLVFPADYQLEANWSYSVVATIEPTEKAYENYRNNNCNYPDLADPDTGDFQNQLGLYANTEASITYRYNGETVTEYFPKPVIKLSPATLVISKVFKGLEKDPSAYSAVLNNTDFKVTLNGKESVINLNDFDVDDTTGIYTYVIDGLSPKTEYSVVEQNAGSPYYVLTTERAGVSGIIGANEVATASFENSYKPVMITVSGGKTWDDEDNRDGKRPANITVHLLADGEVVDTVTVASDNAAWSFTVHKYNQGKEIVYTVMEDAVDGYAPTYSGMNVTNTYNPAKMDITVQKIWNDANNQDGIRPESIQVQLYANGTAYGEPVTLYADDWTYTWTDMYVNANGEEIKYTVEEVSVPGGYEASVDGLKITNTHNPEKIVVSGSKTWEDANDNDGVRPEFIIINLWADGEKIDSKKVTAADNWAWSFNNLNKYAAGKEIVYTITEDAVEGYTSVVNGYDVTNTHKVEKTEVTVNKIWNDNDDQDGKRPGTITVRLFANGVEVGSKEITADDGWKCTFTELNVYNAGKEIVYTITEDAVEGYKTVINGFDVTNTHEIEKTEVTVNKVWNDNQDQDGIRPNFITINLLADGVKIASKDVTAADNWAVTFTGLDKFADGKEIKYTVTEEAVAGYETEINGFTVTNIHVPEKIDVSGSKTWNDDDNRDGKRPASIKVHLNANGTEVDSLTVTEQDGWAWTFEDVDKYANGKEIEYTVTEEAVKDYTPEYDGMNIINSYKPQTQKVTVKKIWNDANNQDGIRPERIQVQLYANGTAYGEPVTLTAENWSYTWNDVFVFENGKEIEYTVKEVPVPEGYQSVINGLEITNTHDPVKTVVSGSKTWDDENNNDGVRPESITINLLADGVKIDSKVVTAEDNWAWSFSDLDKFAAGKEIKYTITEDAVENYTSEVIDHNVTNTHKSEKTEITVNKIWNDNDDQDGIRPNSVTIHLLANGEKIATKVITAEDGWKCTFSDLYVYKAGAKIEYTVVEDAVEGYETEVDGTDVINTHVPSKIEINVSKVWVDNNNADGLRADKVTIVLLADGKDTGMKLVLDAAGQWKGAFENLDEYAGGKKIVYTIRENEVKGYGVEITGDAENGFVVTNTQSVIPETGDSSLIGAFAIAMILSICLFAVLIVSKKRLF